MSSTRDDASSDDASSGDASSTEGVSKVADSGEASSAEAASSEPANVASAKGPQAWIKRLAARLPVTAGLAIAAALDASILPNPLEPLLVGGMLARPKRVWIIATAATLGCMAGATMSYLAGVFLLEPVAEPLLARFGLIDNFESVKERLRNDGPLAIFIISMTPVPLPLAPLAAGATGLNPLLTIGLVGLFRGLRYFTIAALARFFESALREAAGRMTSPWATWIMLALGVAGLTAIFVL